MKKRNSKGRFTYDKNWYIRNYKKLLFLIATIVLAYMYFVTIAEAQEKPLELSCDNFLSPTSCDEIYGFNNFKIEESSFWVEAPHTYEHNKCATQSAEEPTSNILTEGKSSWYSVDGCLGCNDSRRMANGDVLDDTKLTLAVTPELMHEHLLLNDIITVTNLDNGKSVQAKVTDTGGFAKYNRVADLSVALSQELECINCKVRLEK